MMAKTPNYVEIDKSALDLLARNVSNEIVNGLELQDFEAKIGIPKHEFQSLCVALRGLPKGESTNFHVEQARIFHNALEVVMEELGVEEFDTRTGHPFAEGTTILQVLAGFVEMHEGGRI
jgi:hypothetical protein